MRPLRYSINVTLDGCCDHQAIIPDAEQHEHAMHNIERADAIILGRRTYELMEQGWRGDAADAMPEWTQPFAQVMNAAKKYVVSSTLESVDWNSELLRGDLRTAVQQLKERPGEGLATGGLQLPRALAELGLIDEFEFIVQPVVVGHGPTLFSGLRNRLDLELVDSRTFDSGAVAFRYVRRGVA